MYVYEKHDTTMIRNNITYHLILSFEEEDIPLEDTFDDSVDDIKDLYHKINNGNLVYFYASMKCYVNGIELSIDSLGSCLYKSYEDFITESGYYSDMIETCINEANKNLKKLCSEYQKLEA